MNSMTKTLLLTILIALVATPAFALNPTTTGRIAVTPTDTAIWVSAYYTEDTNVNNTLQITWKLSSNPVWPAPQYSLPHAASPYTQKIPGLTNGTEYDVRVDFVDADGVTGTDPQYAYRVIPSTMMHNSENATVGTRKWDAQGGWGIPGGVYGQFECSTCHTPTTANIMRVWTTVATPNGTYWGSTNRSKLPVNFQSRTLANGFGDDTGGHATSTKICEVCHIQTDYHRYNTAGQGDLTHNNNSDCTSSCHKHNDGFKGAGGTCNACHGATPSVFWSVDKAGSYAGNAPGAHAKHFGLDQWYTTAYDDTNLSTGTYYRFQCNKCHETAHSASPTPNITLPGTSAPRASGGTYSNVTNQCSTVYCHGSTLTAGSVPTPTWAVGGVTCGACHGANGTTPPTAGAHQRHATSGTYAAGTKQGLNLSCASCHGPNAGATNHVNGDVTWWLTTGSTKFGANATYRGWATGSTGAEAPSASYGQCNNIYCHSIVQTSPPGGAVTYTAQTWTTTPTTCSSCHPDQTTAWSGSHQQHMAYPFTCDICHSGAGSETAAHADRNINVSLSGIAAGGTYNGTPAPGDAYNTCSTVYCHSNGAGSYVAVPRWGSLNTGACGTCHGVDNATVPPSAPHSKHVATASGYQYACSRCHYTVVTSTANAATVPAIFDTNLHVNNAKNVGFDLYNPSGSWISPSCTVTYCHSQGTGATAQTGDVRALAWKTMNWSGTTNCGTCHGADTTGQPQYANSLAAGAKRNSHTAHRPWNTVVSCSVCHYGTTTTSTSITGFAAHVDKTYDIQANPTTWMSIASYTYAYDGGTCNNSTCHAGRTPKWGTMGYDSGSQTPSRDWDCISCHSYAFKKNLGTGTIRQVVGRTGSNGDFNMWVTAGNLITARASRHLFGASTIIRWDCIVCHQEGQAFGGSAGGVNWDMHNDRATAGLINLRNVDTINESIGWAVNNKTWSTTDYRNLDEFCLTCHDADGATAVSVNGTNSGIGGTALKPFNSTDQTIRASTEMTGSPRLRVTNVKDQFYAGTTVVGAGGGVSWVKSGATGAAYNGNPSQHAVIGRRYSTINLRWGTFNNQAWSSVILKKMGVNLRTVKETALLSCADCHVLDAGNGAHGGARNYNLWSTVGGGAVNLCWRCHGSVEYNFATPPTNYASRVQHANIDGGRNNFSYNAYGFNAGNGQCFLCHAGWNGTSTVSRQASYGGIHGSSWTTYAAGTPITNYRFFPGAWFRVGGTMGNGSWTTTTAYNCYFWNYQQSQSAATWQNCNSHSGANATLDATLNYSRPTKY